MSDPVPLKSKDVALRLGVSVKTVHNYCKQGRLPFFIIPAGKRFDLADIEHFIQSRKFNHQREI